MSMVARLRVGPDGSTRGHNLDDTKCDNCGVQLSPTSARFARQWTEIMRRHLRFRSGPIEIGERFSGNDLVLLAAMVGGVLVRAGKIATDWRCDEIMVAVTAGEASPNGSDVYCGVISALPTSSIFAAPRNGRRC
jgi:hypothetical protein